MTAASPITDPSHAPQCEPWPELPLTAWVNTCTTLRLWMQIVGKIRLTQSPWLNHSWHTSLYVTARGLTTSPIPYECRVFQIDFDFIAHQLRVETTDGGVEIFPLEPESVAEFYDRLMKALGRLGLRVRIFAVPNEIDEPIPFARDEAHSAYDAEYANRFWRILVQADRVFKKFRAPFLGKCSPVQFFWGSGDLAVTRFSGRAAPRHPGGAPHLPDWVVRDAYSHEVSSAGFWPGGGAIPYAAFYSYAYPEPAGFAKAVLKPPEAFYSEDLREFILPYDAVRKSESPDATLLAFLNSAYDAAANLGRWKRKELERTRDPRSSRR